MFERKKQDKAYIIREVDIDTYGTYTNFSESISCCSTKEEAAEFVECCADSFERVYNNMDDCRTVRLCDDQYVKVLICRTFGGYLFLHERRLFVTEREI